MKKFLCLVLLILISIPLTGCLKRDEFENVTVYTTSYPIEFLTNILYGYNSDVRSIFPAGVDIRTFELTEKQKRDFSRAAIFIYSGLTDEKKLAKDFINRNRNLRIIDVSFGLRYEHSVEELWLSPNNFLMLAINIRNNLQDFITNRFIIDEIETNYRVRLEEPLSLMDAQLRNIGRMSRNDNRNTIIASCRLFRFLENYGFEVIVLDEDLTVSSLNTITENFRDDTFKYIFIRHNETPSELINDLVDNHGAEILRFHVMENLTDAERNDNENYFTIMGRNIELIKTATIGR